MREVEGGREGKRGRRREGESEGKGREGCRDQGGREECHCQLLKFHFW